MVLDFWFSIPYENLSQFVFGLEYCSANRDIWHRSAIVLPQGLIENETGVWIPIEDYSMSLDLTDNYSVWHHANLKVDLHSGKYIQLIIDDYTFDLSAYNMYNRMRARILIDDVTVMLE